MQTIVRRLSDYHLYSIFQGEKNALRQKEAKQNQQKHQNILR